MRHGHTRRGQSLVEFALVLPVLLLIVFAFVQLLLVLRAQSALSTIANLAARQAAVAGAETPDVDSAILSLARQNGLDPALVQVQVSTNGGTGAWHTATGAGNATSAAYDGQITVDLRYAYPVTLPFVPIHDWTVTATASELSQMDGRLPKP